MPLFPVNDYVMGIHTALQQPVFRAALYLASPSFYARLAAAGFDEANMSVKEINTVARYLNRACYRPTPFGYFASVSIASWEKQGHILLKDPPLSLTAFVQPSEKVLQERIRIAAKGFSDQPFEPNPTLYRVQKSYRFIREENDEAKHRSYRLQSSQYSVVLNNLLKFCRGGQTKDRIIQCICKLALCDPEEGAEYFDFLQDAQILLPTKRPGISEPICNLARNRFLFAGLITYNEPSAEKHGQDALPDAELLRDLDINYHQLAGLPLKDEQSALNVIMTRKLESAILDERYQAEIRSGMFALDKLCPEDQLPALARFKDGFQRHFDEERQPLLSVIDPERGIGYQSEPNESPNPLLETVNIRQRSLSMETGTWSERHRFLMSSWLKMERDSLRVLQLDESGLTALTGSRRNLTALGASVLFRPSAEGLFIESAGGANPLALIGRFTLADEHLLTAAREMAGEIESINPELIFAEILHLGDPHIDNVNRRGTFWKYELPLLAAGTKVPERLTVALDDLYVEVSGEYVLLWSKKHRRYVIPRLSSAYNHSIDQLPLFRFLADLSYQFGRTQLSFDLLHFFPGLDFYPRVACGPVILSLAAWNIDVAEQQELIRCTSDGDEGAWQRFFEKYGLPDQFFIAEGDQQLIFNRKIKNDLSLFRDTMRGKKQIIVREWLSIAEPEPVFQASGRTRYVAQINAFLLPDEPLQLPVVHDQPKDCKAVQRKFIPGTQWLYLKLYLPRLSANRLLLQLKPLLRKRFSHGRIRKWFFIRYEDHAPHIRLRLQINPEDIESVLAALRLLLEDNIHQHLIREYQVDVYTRELERYQAVGIEKTEMLFWVISEFVLCYLYSVKSGSTVPSFLIAAKTVQAVTTAFYPEEQQQLVFWQSAFESFVTEFDGPRLKVEMDQKFREMARIIDGYLSADGPFPEKPIQQAYINLRSLAAEAGASISDEAMKNEYLKSLVHMHLNRLFTDQQRKQEMMIYFLLYKWMRSKMARTNKAIKPPGLS